MVTKTMTWKCYQLCHFWVIKEACKQTSRYTHFVCVLQCKPVCVCNCIVKSPPLDEVSYVHIYTHSSSGVLSRSRTGLGAASDTTLNPFQMIQYPKLQLK